MYHFREVTCPNCGHQFVYLENSYKGSIYPLYSRRGYNEKLESTICPKCSIEMVVLKDSSTGIDIRDDSIEVVTVVRGI